MPHGMSPLITNHDGHVILQKLVQHGVRYRDLLVVQYHQSNVFNGHTPFSSLSPAAFQNGIPDHQLPVVHVQPSRVAEVEGALDHFLGSSSQA
jgi:hypothetical protein